MAGKLMKTLMYGTMILSTTTSFTGITTLTVNANTKPSETTTSGKGIPTKPKDDKLQAAVAAAKKLGLKVDENTKELVVDAKDTASKKLSIEADYAVQVKSINDAVNSYKSLKTQYDKDYDQYEKDLKKYNDDVAGQLDDANPQNPLQPGYLANEQPYKLDDNRNSLSKVSGDVSGEITDPTNMPAGTLYNSDNAKIVTIKDASKPVTVTWKNVGKDLKSKKSLDVTVQYSNFELNNVDTFPQGNGSYLAVYSNYVDNVSLMNIATVDQKVSFSYSDNGKAYDKDYYLTSGSQNYGVGAAEFSFPDEKVKATFLNKDTYIYPELQDVYGPAKNKHNKGFRGKDNTDQPTGIGDDTPEALSKLGVSYFVSNGATITVGISGINHNDPHNTNAYSEYDHLMISDNTVAGTINKPVAPVEPKKPNLNANYTNLLSIPKVTKDVDYGTVKGNPDGSDSNKIFMKGDKMTYSLSASALPAGREKIKTLGFSDDLPEGFKYESFKAFDKEGKDVTNDLQDVKVKDGKITGSFTNFNNDLNVEYDVPIINIYGTASKDNVTLKNKYDLLVNGDPYTSNEVETPTEGNKVNKKVEGGSTIGLDGTSIDGKTVVKGQDITYAIEGNDLPANRATNITSMEWTDKLPENIEFKDFKVYDGTTGEDITDNFKNNGKNKDLDIVANADALKDANANKTKLYKVPVVKIHAVANKDGVVLENTAQWKVNGTPVDSNKVHNQTPDYNPVKTDVDDQGNNIDGKEVKPGSVLHYTIDWDLTKLTNVAITQDILKQDLSLKDDYDETKLAVNDDVKKSVTVDLKDNDDEEVSSDGAQTKSNDDTSKAAAQAKTTETKEKVGGSDDVVIIDKGTADKFDMNDVDVTWDDKAGMFSITPKDNAEFLKKYAGKMLEVNFNPTVKEDATGTVENMATQGTFGDNKDTNKVINDITPDAKPQEKELAHTGSNNLISKILTLFSRK